MSDVSYAYIQLTSWEHLFDLRLSEDRRVYAACLATKALLASGLIIMTRASVSSLPLPT